MGEEGKKRLKIGRKDRRKKEGRKEGKKKVKEQEGREERDRGKQQNKKCLKVPSLEEIVCKE